MNPLKAYFRQPELYINLPSQGKYWPEGSIMIPVNGELPVYSMTAADDMLMLTPDALINGSATVNLIQNCIPNIQDAWQTPSVDLEYLLVAIRIASSGANIQIESVCTSCDQNNDYSIDLRVLLERFDPSAWHQPLILGELMLTFRPLNFQVHNDFANRFFQCKKKLSQTSAIEDTEQRELISSEIMSEVNKIDLEYLISNIFMIQTKTVTVTEPEFISEFVLNCDKRTYNQIKNHLDLLKKSTRCDHLELICDNCGHQYSSEFSMDYASFFE
jgi:hypothetical protein